MNRLKTEIVNLFESDEMKACISSEYDSLHILTKADIVKGARTDICKKLKLLKRLYKYADKADNPAKERLKSDINEFDYAVKNFCGVHGDVYIVGEYGFDDDIGSEKLYGYYPYTSIYKALEYIKTEWEDAKESYADGLHPTFWYTVEKYSPDDIGKMHEQVCWLVTADGTVTGFSGAGRTVDVNVPHPFSEGDIVVMDSTPSYPERIGLIIETAPHPDDCCKPQALYFTKEGLFKANALKHATVFGDYFQLPLFSPIYRLKTYDGELSENIKIFKKISNALKSQGTAGAYPSLGNILWGNICAADKAGKGVSESELDEISERSIKEWYLREYSG